MLIETRTVRHPDGTQEIVCILNDEVLGGWTPRRPLAFEKSVVWLQPITEFEFVRVAHVRQANSRRGPLIARGAGMVVGYSTLTVDAPRDPITNTFSRRLFYLTESDLQLNLNQIPPAVLDPKTILPRVEGQPPRARNLDRGYPKWACQSVVEAPSVTASTRLSA